MSLNPIADLREYAKNWVSRVQRLMNTDVPAEMTVEKMGLITRAKKIRDMIQSLTGAQAELEPLNQLGVWPLLIPVIVGGATVVGAITAIRSWDSDLDLFEAKLKEIKRLENTGMTSAAAHALVNSTAPNKGGWMSLLPIALVGGALWFFLG
jgi:hypothetical protein